MISLANVHEAIRGLSRSLAYPIPKFHNLTNFPSAYKSIYSQGNLQTNYWQWTWTSLWHGSEEGKFRLSQPYIFVSSINRITPKVGARTRQLVPMLKRKQRCRCRRKQSGTFELQDPLRYRQQRLHPLSNQQSHYKGLSA